MAYNNNPNNPTPEHVTAGVHNHGAYTLQQCKLRNIGNVPKIVGLQVVTLDTAEIYIWIDGNGPAPGTWNSTWGTWTGWYKVGTAENWHGFSVAVDGVTIGGDGTTASPLTVLSVIDKYYLANEPYQLNKVVHADAGEIGIMAGIYKLLTEHERVWQPYYPKRLMPGIAQTFNPGDYFYINNLGAPYEHYNGIYWVNDDVTHVGIAILITQTDVHDLEDHLIAGNVVQMTTASGPMYPWQPNHQYGLADLVIGKYVPDAATGVFVPDYSVFYERIVPDSANPLDWQHEFSEFNDVLGWKLLADISGSMIGIIQTGMSVGYPWTDVADPIPIGYLHCAGQAVSKSMYVDLYAIIGDTYGSSASTFNLPTAYNFIIKF